jgi:hypothetical protein
MNECVEVAAAHTLLRVLCPLLHVLPKLRNNTVLLRRSAAQFRYLRLRYSQSRDKFLLAYFKALSKRTDVLVGVLFLEGEESEI